MWQSGSSAATVRMMLVFQLGLSATDIELAHTVSRPAPRRTLTFRNEDTACRHEDGVRGLRGAKSAACYPLAGPCPLRCV